MKVHVAAISKQNTLQEKEVEQQQIYNVFILHHMGLSNL